MAEANQPSESAATIYAEARELRKVNNKLTGGLLALLLGGAGGGYGIFNHQGELQSKTMEQINTVRLEFRQDSANNRDAITRLEGRVNVLNQAITDMKDNLAQVDKKIDRLQDKLDRALNKAQAAASGDSKMVRIAGGPGVP